MLARTTKPSAGPAEEPTSTLAPLSELDRELETLLAEDVSELVLGDATTRVAADAADAAVAAVPPLEARVEELEARVRALESALANLTCTVEGFEARCEATLTEAATAAAESVLRLVGEEADEADASGASDASDGGAEG